MAFEHRLKVRYSETDQMGITHHANHLLFMEEARIEYMRRLGFSYRELEEAGIGLPVRSLEVNYVGPAFFDDELVVRVGVARVAAASVVFEYALRRADSPVATGQVELACVKLATRRPVMFPKDLRAALAEEVDGDRS